MTATLVALAVGVTFGVQEWGVDTYAPLVAAVAITAWYGGMLPGLLAVVLGWATSWALVLDHPGEVWEAPSRVDLVEWLAPLGVALVVLWIGWALRRGAGRAASRADSAEREQFMTEAVQRLTRELSSAVTPSDVAHTLVVHLPRLLGSTGAALGLVEGDELHIVDPEGAPKQTLTPGLRLPLGARAPITVAARTGEVTFVASRHRLERDFPDAAALAPDAAGALAVPLRAGRRVVGSMGFPFAMPDALDDEVIALARLAAELGGQALERAGLYEQERGSREALERITRLAPRFGSESPSAVLETVCTEAIETFGSDIAQVWSVDGDSFIVLWREPRSDQIPPGMRVAAADFPGLAQAIERLETMFIPDSLVDIRGAALEHARHFGIRSSLRVPVSVGGSAERVLVLQWRREIPEPSASTIVLARRFADQAGLALEHAERRVAQTEASRNADETRRLLAVTGALSAALEPISVAEATLREAFRSLGACAGSVVRLDGERELELVSAVGYEDRTLVGWERFALDADVPLSEAVRANEIVALENPQQRAVRYPGLVAAERGHAAWLALPLDAGGRVVGGLGLSFGEPRTFTDADREFALALARQAGQALERSSLLEGEHAARMRAERMASDLAQLHALATSLGRARSADDVTGIIGEQMVHGVGAASAGIYLAGGEPGVLSLVSVRGTLENADLREYRELPLAASMPISDAVRLARPIWLLSDTDWSRYPGTAIWRRAGISAVGVAPLVVEQAAIGALFVVFESDHEPTDADQRFVETVARQAAQPLERVRLLEEERASRVEAERASLQLRRLQTVTESLAAAPTMAAVAEVILEEGRAALAADGALVHLVDAGSGELALRAASGLPDPISGALRSLRTDDVSPIAEAFREGGTMSIDDVADPADRYAEVARAVDGVFGSLLSIPLTVGGGAIGVVTLLFARAQMFDDDDRRTASIMGRQCAQALERSRLFDEERIARDRSDRLHELTTALSGALTSHEVLEIFVSQAGQAVGASRVAVSLVDREGRLPRDGEWHGNHGWLPEAWLEPGAGAATPLRDVVLQGAPLYFHDRDSLSTSYPGPDRNGAIDGDTVAFVPLLAGRKPFAVAVIAWDGHFPLDDEERAFIEVFASQSGQALDRAQRYETERTIAETLQRSVLPETLPSMEGATVAARYLPGTAAIDVGGDWFDTLPLSDGRLGFVVGDVVGKGVRAASTMAQLRNGMRALTLDSADPASILTKLNRLLEGYTDSPFATLAFLTIDPRTHEADLISAGHLPPLVLAPGGEPTLLDGGRGLPLGVDPEAVYESWPTRFEPGSVIVLYTDGLVERRDRPLDEGLQLLCDCMRGVTADPEEIVDHILAELIGGLDRGDDVAVLAVGLDRAPLGTFVVHLPADRDSLVELRQSFGRWLDRGGIGDADRRDLILATWEASANAIEHARDPSTPTIEVEASLSGDKIRVEVSDSGMWTEPRDRPDRGLGLHLIQALMTAVSVEPSQGGTRVVMERLLSREKAGEGGANAAHDRRP